MTQMTPEQQRQVDAHPGQPVEVLHPVTHQVYYLVSGNLAPNAPVDEDQLRSASLARRDESRDLNQEWADADRSVWNGGETAP